MGHIQCVSKCKSYSVWQSPECLTILNIAVDLYIATVLTAQDFLKTTLFQFDSHALSMHEIINRVFINPNHRGPCNISPLSKVRGDSHNNSDMDH